MWNYHHDSAGWTALLIIAIAISLVMIIHWLRKDLKSSGRRCRDVLLRPSHRLMAGTTLIFGGHLLRLVSTLPEKVMLAIDAWEWYFWWGEVAIWFIDAGTLIILIGLVIMMWPALRDRFGRFTLPAIFVGFALVYAMGAAAMFAAQRLL